MLDLILINDVSNDLNPCSFGKASLATYLTKQGWKVAIIQPYEIQKLSENPTRFFGVGSWSFKFQHVVDAALILKRLYPHIPIIAGGGHLTACPDDLVKHADLFDYWVLGDGEKAVDEILQGFHKPHTPIHRPLENEDIVLPPITLNRIMRGYHESMTSRGCPHVCTFCNAPQMYGHATRRIPLAQYIEHVKYLIAHGATTIHFMDSSFLNNLDWTTQFCDSIIKNHIQLNWIANCCAEQLSENIIFLMKKAGCIGIKIGAESGSPALLKSMRKTPQLTETIKSFRLCKKYGIHTHIFLMYGLLGESKASMAATREFHNLLKPDSTNLFIYQPFPGTAMFDEAQRRGFLSPFDWSKGQPAQLLFTGYMTKTEVLIEAQRLWKIKTFFIEIKGPRKHFQNIFLIIPGTLACLAALKVCNMPIFKSMISTKNCHGGCRKILNKARYYLIGRIFLLMYFCFSKDKRTQAFSFLRKFRAQVKKNQ